MKAASKAAALVFPALLLIGNRLFALADREFKATRAAPVRTKFKGLKLNIGKYDETRDRRRGAAARMMGVVLRDSDETLFQRVCADNAASRTYTDAAAWLQREAEHLRRHAVMLDTAVARLTTVLDRCGKSRISSNEA